MKLKDNKYTQREKKLKSVSVEREKFETNYMYIVRHVVVDRCNSRYFWLSLSVYVFSLYFDQIEMVSMNGRIFFNSFESFSFPIMTVNKP